MYARDTPMNVNVSPPMIITLALWATLSVIMFVESIKQKYQEHGSIKKDGQTGLEALTEPVLLSLFWPVITLWGIGYGVWYLGQWLVTEK